MTLGEIERYIKSYVRSKKVELQEKAQMDYIQASLIIKGVAMVMGSKEPFPNLQEAYPTLFEDVGQNQEEMMKKKQELSALRFKQFAQSYNSRFNKEVPKAE